MAHFAKLDENNIVLQVVVIGDGVPTSDGPLGENDMHPDGETYTANLLGGRWKQTSYNNNFRKQYAGIGMIYDPVKDKFLGQQPHASWSLDSSDDWQAPITYPTVTDDGATPSVWTYIISWNETKYEADNTQGWEATKSNDESETPTKYNWNGSAWVSE